MVSIDDKLKIGEKVSEKELAQNGFSLVQKCEPIRFYKCGTETHMFRYFGPSNIMYCMKYKEPI